MANAHWKHHNHFIHYGAAGFDMFSTGYAAKIDDDARPQYAFEFDDIASKSSHDVMMEQIPKALAKQRGGVRVQDFFLERVNTTPATKSMIAQAILSLVRERDVEVVGDNGSIRHVRKALQNDHVLRLPDQRPLVFMGR